MKTKVEKHFDKVAKNYDSGKQKYSYYYSNLKKLLKSMVRPKSKVLEIGCGTGDLLASINPNRGFGQDISPEMIRIAKNKYKNNKHLKFSTVWPSDKYDYIFMSDVIEHLEEPDSVFKKIYKLMNGDSALIITMANPKWEPLLMFWEKMGWKMREGPHERIGFEEIHGILKRNGLKIIKHDYRLLIPIEIPVITELVNRYLEPKLKKYAFIEYFMAAKR